MKEVSPKLSNKKTKLGVTRTKTKLRLTFTLKQHYNSSREIQKTKERETKLVGVHKTLDAKKHGYKYNNPNKAILLCLPKRTR